MIVERSVMEDFRLPIDTRYVQLECRPWHCGGDYCVAIRLINSKESSFAIE
jgi:hypothetical protein